MVSEMLLERVILVMFCNLFKGDTEISIEIKGKANLLIRPQTLSHYSNIGMFKFRAASY